MGNSWSARINIQNQGQQNQLQIEEAELYIPRGLPNQGATCFLNSVLQQLYRIEVIHDFFSAIPEKKCNTVLKNLKRIFTLMKTNSSQDLKKALRNFKQVQLRKIVPTYYPGDQYDSLEVFFTILDTIFCFDKKIKQEFEFFFQQGCKCSGMIKLSQIYIEDQEEWYCSDCGKPIKRIYTNFPHYLILRNPKKHIKKLKWKKRNFEYRLQSRNIYFGNKLSGHYITECEYGGETYSFDDRQRSKAGNVRQPCLFAIYQKVYIQQMSFVRVFSQTFWLISESTQKSKNKQHSSTNGRSQQGKKTMGPTKGIQSK